MSVARHFRTLEPIRAADGRMGVITAHAVNTDRLYCLMDDGSRRDVSAETVDWVPAERCWVEAR